MKKITYSNGYEKQVLVYVGGLLTGVINTTGIGGFFYIDKSQSSEIFQTVDEVKKWLSLAANNENSA